MELTFKESQKKRHPQITFKSKKSCYYPFSSPIIELNVPVMARYMSNNVYQNILDVHKDNKLGYVNVLSVDDVLSLI